MTDLRNDLNLSLSRMKWLLCLITILTGFEALAQDQPGIIMGTVLDEKGQALDGATVQLTSFIDSNHSKNVLTYKNGSFQLSSIAFGYYQLKISFTGFTTLTLDSIHFRTERFDFNLNDLVLKSRTAENENMEEVVIYLEKPLVQSSEGNISFNACESALSAGSSASDLLTSVPLVTKDPNGKILVRGKEPKILIDDKPVELNLEQLQDLLESMPGSTVEKIEVMTNPPPQYANEQGGVINIVTKKGSVGISGRISLYAGTRGEAGANGSFNYRKKGLSLNVNAGAVYNEFEGEGFSRRENLNSRKVYTTSSGYDNKNMRPNLRMNLNYDLNKYHNLNLVFQYNQNDYNNKNLTRYKNLDSFENIFHLSNRQVTSTGDNYNPNLSLSYTLKTKKPGESLRLITNFNFSNNRNDRGFYQAYFNPDDTPTGEDSTQQQFNHNRNRGYHFRLNYDLPLVAKKTYLSIGSLMAITRSNVETDASYLKKPDEEWFAIDALTNRFLFRQSINNVRASVKQMLGERFSLTAGLNADHSSISFDFYKTSTDTANRYWSFLPFINLNRSWKEKMNLSFSYRRTIRRPGLGELNPTINFSDPYNTRFGNPGLLPAMSHNFDLVIGKTTQRFYANAGMGYNIVEDIFSQVRTLQDDGKTQTTWENISGRKEYELSTWSGYTVSKKLRLNLSASYIYNTYSSFDKEVRHFRDGGSFTSNLNTNFSWKGIYNATGNFSFNRFANPQGTVKSTLRMNLGLQARLLNKKMTITFNAIDPFVQQRNRSFTYGNDFTLESRGTTATKNFRLSLGYTLSRTTRKLNLKKSLSESGS
jgi:hypothetical protein